MKLINHAGHRYAVERFLYTDFDDATRTILEMQADTFDRYSNPFEQKHTLRDKFRLPHSLALLIGTLELEASRLSQLFGVRLYPDLLRHYCGVFKYMKGDKLDVHVDAGIHPQEKKRKHVTAVLYLGRELAPLELWEGENCAQDNPQLIRIADGIEPKHGTLVVFENNDYAWHGVPICDSEGPRIVVTVSYLSDAINAFENKRQRAFFVPRPLEPWTAEQYELRNKRADPERYKEVYRVPSH
jgi:Rps23 Pro-64 3,4-dihydroxylase Tpa1-like proline 4-hydroxylase